MAAIPIRPGLRRTIPGNTCRFWLTAPEDSMARTWACARRWRIWGRPWRRILAERFLTELVFWRNLRVELRSESGARETPWVRQKQIPRSRCSLGMNILIGYSVASAGAGGESGAASVIAGAGAHLKFTGALLRKDADLHGPIGTVAGRIRGVIGYGVLIADIPGNLCADGLGVRDIFRKE